MPAVISIILSLTLHREDSLNFVIEKDKINVANKIIARIYPNETAMRRQQILENLQKQLKQGSGDEEGSNKIGLWESLTHPDYRRATWVCIGVATANQMSGINVINMFSTDIL